MRFFTAPYLMIFGTCALLIAGAAVTSVPAQAQSGAAQSADPSATQMAMPPFFEILPDIPVMPGMQELVDEAIIFDKPEGRFIKTTAISESHTKSQIIQFYSKALPALGWMKISDLKYKRGTYLLTIAVEQTDNIQIIYFTVEPE